MMRIQHLEKIMNDSETSDKLKIDPNTSKEFCAISPLEPLDPNKFRNIMLDKQESSNRTDQCQLANVMQQSLDSRESTSREQNMRTFQQPQMLVQNQNPTYPQSAMIQQNIPYQHNMPANPNQQYFNQPQQAAYGMPFSGGNMQHPMQQASYPQNQQWVQVQHQECNQMQNPQLYNIPQNNVCVQQQHSAMTMNKTMPQPNYQITEQTAFVPHQQLPPHQMALQKQIPQEYNYPMSQSQIHPSQQYIQPAYNPVPYGIDVRQPQEFTAYHNNSTPPTNFVKKPQSAEKMRPLANAGFITPTDYTRTAAFGFTAHQRPQHLRMPVSLHPQQQFVGHDSQFASTLNPDVCLAGCVFLLIEDCNPQMVDSSLLPNVIRFYGGDIESNNPRGIPERVTHIICSSWMDNESLIQQALCQNVVDRMPRRMKRIVTVNWLNNAIEKRRVDPPSQACHLPSFWSVVKQNPQLSSRIISITGFDVPDSNAIKFMIQLIGAKFSPFTTKSDFLIVSRSTPTETIQKLYFGNINVLSPSEWQNFAPESENYIEVSILPQQLAKTTEFCHKLMVPWTQPILIADEIIKAAYELRSVVLKDNNIFPEKTFSIIQNAPTEEQIKQANSLIAAYNGKRTDVYVFVEGLFPEQIENLYKKVRFLGGIIAENIPTATHFVTPNLRKSVNLVEAIALGKHIVTPLWVETSFKRLEFIDPLPFFVKDRENERKMGFGLKTTILLARQRRIFQDVTFHISKNVRPSFELIKKLLESSGGKIQIEKPKKRELLQCIQENKTFFIVCNRNDLPFYQYLVNCNFPLFNEDFVIMSILRHKILYLADEFHAYPSRIVPLQPNTKR